MAGWIERPLDEELLNLIDAVQMCDRAAMSQNILFGAAGFGERIRPTMAAGREFFFGLPPDLVERNGLARDNDSLSAILNFKVTDAMRRTDFENLDVYTFCHWSRDTPRTSP